MPLIVGNLLTDPAAQSFISLDDAMAYLGVEGPVTRDREEDWFWLGDEEQEGRLTHASRWLALTLPWRHANMTDAQIVTVGHVAARLADQSRGADLFSAQTLGPTAKRYKAGSVEIEYATAGRVRGAQAAGLMFPWLYPMLRGLLCDTGAQHSVVRR